MSDSVQVWRSRLEEAKKQQGEVIAETNDYANAYNGRFPTWIEGRHVDNISHNYVYKVCQLAQAAFMYRDPTIQLPPSSKTEYQTHSLVEQVLNRIFRETGALCESRLVLRDALIRGAGYMKLGYHADYSPSEEDMEIDSPEAVNQNIELLIQGKGEEIVIKPDEDHALHIQLMQSAIIDNPPVLMDMLQRLGVRGLMEVVSQIEARKDILERQGRKGKAEYRVPPNTIWAQYQDFRDVLIDPMCTRFEDARWVAFRKVYVLNNLKKIDVYKYTKKLEAEDAPPHNPGEEGINTGTSQITPDILAKQILGMNKSKKPSQSANQKDDENFRVEVYEIWDKATSQVLVISNQEDRFLRRDVTPFKNLPGFFPLARLSFIDRMGTDVESEPKRVYGYSWVAPWWEQQVELCKFVTVRLEIAKHNVPRYIGAAGVSQSFLQKLMRGEVGAFTQLTEVEGGGQIDASKAVAAVQTQGVPQSIDTTIMMLQDQISFISGFSEIQLAGQSTARTATAAAIQQQQATAFGDMMLQSIEKFFSQMAKIMRAMARQFYTPDRVIVMEGDAGAKFWQEYLDEDLYGDALDVVPGSTKPATDNMKQVRWSELYKLSQLDPIINRQWVLEQLLKSMGISNTEVAFNTAPPPQNMMPQDAPPAQGGQQPQTLGDVAGQAAQVPAGDAIPPERTV